MKIRTFRLLAALSLAAAPVVHAADMLVVPADVAANQQKLLPLIPATVQPKVLYTARTLVAPIMKGTLTEESAKTAVIAMFGEADIETIAALVLMMAAKEGEADLRQMLDEMDKLNEQKRKIREYVDALKSRRAAMSKEVAAEYRARASQPTMMKTPFLQLAYARYEPFAPIDPSRLTLAAIDALIADSEAKLDSMSEMGEMESLRLQMAMDRMSKMMTMLSNMMKKISDTSGSIIQNLK